MTLSNLLKRSYLTSRIRFRSLSKRQCSYTVGQNRVPVTQVNASLERRKFRIDQRRSAAYSTVPSDEIRDAVPFAKEMLPKLTPTMRNFTLDGKVAVITG